MLMVVGCCTFVEKVGCILNGHMIGIMKHTVMRYTTFLELVIIALSVMTWYTHLSSKEIQLYTDTIVLVSIIKTVIKVQKNHFPYQEVGFKWMLHLKLNIYLAWIILYQMSFIGTISKEGSENNLKRVSEANLTRWII